MQNLHSTKKSLRLPIVLLHLRLAKSRDVRVALFLFLFPSSTTGSAEHLSKCYLTHSNVLKRNSMNCKSDPHVVSMNMGRSLLR